MSSVIQSTDFADSSNHKAVIDILLEQLRTINQVVSKQDRTIEKQDDTITQLKLVIHRFTHKDCGEIGDGVFWCKGQKGGCQYTSLYGRSGNIYGTNPYLYQVRGYGGGQQMCGCAMHAGLIGKEGGYYKANTNYGPQDSLAGSTENGITSQVYQGRAQQSVFLSKHEE